VVAGNRGCFWAFFAVVVVFIVGVAVFIVFVFLAVDRAPDGGPQERRQESADVEVTDCTTSPTGTMVAGVRVTNRSSERSDYLVTVVFEDDGDGSQVDSSPVAVNDVDPGQAASGRAVTFSRPPPAGFGCEVGAVERVASG